MKQIGILVSTLLLFSFWAKAQHYLDSSTTFYKNGENIHVAPGDTVYFLGGDWDYIMLENFHGTEDSVITFINTKGKVYIHNTHYFGINVKNCTHIHLTGTGDTAHPYGFHIAQVTQGGGIGFGNLSNFFEMDHFHIENVHIAGVYAKTDPDQTFAASRDSFLMEDIYIHHNLFNDISDEGLYIGSTKYFGQTISYNGSDTLVFPHLLKNVEISYNEFYDIGWDAIQLSSATLGKNSIHDNIILRDSKRMTFNQMSGIMVGGGTHADVYNNYIQDGKGSGMVIASLGGQRIFNNVIINAGQGFYPDDPMQMQHGIYVGDISMMQDSALYIFHNTIVHPKSDCIRFTSLNSKNNIIANNVLVDPGNYAFYDTLHTSWVADDAYIMISDPNISIDTFSNRYSQDVFSLGFTDPMFHDYTLLQTSVLRDQASHHPKVHTTFDHNNNPRPFESYNDIGAFEFDTATVHMSEAQASSSEMHVYPNPAGKQLNVLLHFPCDTTMDARLFSLQGSQQAIRVTAHPYEHRLSIDVSSLATGIYLLKVSCGEKMTVKKVIVSNSATE